MTDPKVSVNGLTVPDVTSKPRVWAADPTAAQWLNYLLWCLDRDQALPGTPTQFDYHYLKQLHSDYEHLLCVSLEDGPGPDDICLGSDRAWFNFYVNIRHNTPEAKSATVLTQLAGLQKQNLVHDLDWCMIWHDPTQFIDCLGALTNRTLKHNRISQQVIAQYSRICVWHDPKQFLSHLHDPMASELTLALTELDHKIYYPDPLADARNSGNYCPLIFAGLYVEKIDQDSVQLAACCLNRVDSKKTTKTDFVSNSHLQNQRDVVSRGLPVSGCYNCYKNVLSPQENFRVQWSAHPVDASTPKLQKLDYNVDPICNAACVHCSSYYSSAWLAEDQRHGVKFQTRQFGSTRKNHAWQDLDLSDLKYLYINGGEPLLSDEPLPMLQHLDHKHKLSDIHFSFNTNGSIRPNHELLALMKKCRSVVWNFSIDGIEQEFEYIRYPLIWQQVADNVAWASNQHGNFIINIACSVGIHNIDAVDRIVSWVDQVNATLPPSRQALKFLSSPVFGVLSLENAEPQLRQVWLNRYSGPQNWHQQAREILLRPAQPSGGGWQQHLDMLDQRRGLDWRQSLPELYQSWKLSHSSTSS